VAIQSLRNSGIVNFLKYRSLLAGNPPDANYQLIATTSLQSSQSFIDFSNLNNFSSYKHLQIRMVAQSTQAGTSSGGVIAIIELNGNALTKSHYLYTSGGNSVTSSDNSNAGFLVNLIRSGSTNSFSASIVDILDAFSSNKNKTLRWIGGHSSEVALVSNLWTSNSPISSIRIRTSSDNFSTGSRFSLYGIKG
jgi:hypothetical protein